MPTTRDQRCTRNISLNAYSAAALKLGATRCELIEMLSSSGAKVFGRAFGVDIVSGPLRGRLAHAVLIRDADNRVLHAELAREIMQSPDVDTLIAKLVGNQPRREDCRV